MKFLSFLLCLPLIAAVDGTVINRTTGKPQSGATVSLFKLSEAGPESIETVKTDSEGKFALQSTAAGGPHFVQAAYDGVTYTKMMPPGSPSTGLEVEVYNSQSKPGDAGITQHMLLLEPVEGKLTVTENIIFQNSGKTTFNDPTGGTLRFYVPPEAQGKVRVMGTAPGGMPIERAPFPSGGANVFGVDFPIKPGETRFQFAYEVALPNPPVFQGKLLHKEGTTRLVTPRGVSLKGEGLSELGREPATQAAIYNLTGQNFKVEITGSGTLRGPAGSENNDEGPGIQEILPRLYSRLYVVLGLVAGILFVGFIMLYRNSGAATRTVAASGPPEKGKRRG